MHSLAYTASLLYVLPAMDAIPPTLFSARARVVLFGWLVALFVHRTVSQGVCVHACMHTCMHTCMLCCVSSLRSVWPGVSQRCGAHNRTESHSCMPSHEKKIVTVDGYVVLSMHSVLEKSYGLTTMLALNGSIFFCLRFNQALMPCTFHPISCCLIQLALNSIPSMVPHSSKYLPCSTVKHAMVSQI